MIHGFIPPSADFRSDVQQNNPIYQVQDENSADVGTVKRIAREAFYIAGANAQVHARTSNHDIEGVHDEDPDPTYWAPKPFKVYFVPQPLEFDLKEWGVETENMVEAVFWLDDVSNEFQERLLRPGDLIDLPFGSRGEHKPKYYFVTNAQEFGNYRYNWLYLRCHAVLVPGDVNIRPATDNEGQQIMDFPDPFTNRGD